MNSNKIVTGFIVVVVIFLIANYQNIFKSVLPPDPVIVSSKADGSSSTIFDYSMKITGEVRNRGGDGYVVIESLVDQEGQKWTKTKQMYMPSHQTSRFEIVFDEVELFDADPKYSIRAYALGH